MPKGVAPQQNKPPEPTPASRAIDVAERWLRDHGVNPDRHGPTVLTGIDNTHRTDRLFMFEIHGEDGGGIILQVDSSKLVDDGERETAKARITKVNEYEKCGVGDNRRMRMGVTESRLGTFKLVVLARVVPNSGETMSPELFQERWLDVFSLFSYYDILKGLEWEVRVVPRARPSTHFYIFSGVSIPKNPRPFFKTFAAVSTKTRRAARRDLSSSFSIGSAS